MSLQTLVKNIDDQFSYEARRKAAEARAAYETEVVAKLLDKTNARPDKADFHKGAQSWRSEEADGCTVATQRYFGELAKAEGIYPEDRERDYWENYWLRALRVNAFWDEPQREFKVRQFANDWWALMKVFEDQGNPAWPMQPTASVQKAFTTSSLQTVFPIFFDTNIQAGLLADPVLERLVSRSVPVNSHTATHIKMTDTTADQTMGEGGEGTAAIQLLVSIAERTIKLRKFTGEIDWTYEVMRLARLDVLAESLQRIGRRYNQLKTDFALSVLIDGDGAGDGAATTSAATTTGTPIYNDLTTAEFVFPQGYTPDTIVAPKEVLVKILAFAEYKDPLAGILHQTTGAIPRPLGMDLVRWDSTGRVTTYLATTAVMFDSNLALIEYTEGGIITETERIIRSQWEASVVSQWVGYGVWDRSAAVLLTGW